MAQFPRIQLHHAKFAVQTTQMTRKTGKTDFSGELLSNVQRNSTKNATGSFCSANKKIFSHISCQKEKKTGGNKKFNKTFACKLNMICKCNKFFHHGSLTERHICWKSSKNYVFHFFSRKKFQ